jgi:hypothetical protein
MISAIKSVAILKANLDENKDLLDNYVPFIANLARVHSYDGVDVNTIQKDFLAEYGLQIPYHPIVSILNRCAQKGIVRCRDKEYRFDRAQIAKHSFASESPRIEAMIDALIDAFRKFAEAEFKKVYSIEETTSVITVFLQSYDADIILSSRDISLLPQVDIDKQGNFVFYKFVLHIYTHESEIYRNLVELAVGYLYASSVLFTQLKKGDNAVKNLRIVFDTRLLLRLVGLEGEERKEVYRKLVETLKSDGAKLKVFEHTVEEMDGILEDCIKWVANSEYNPRYAGPALKHFVENRYTVSDVVLFKASLESQLTQHGIRRIDGGFGFGLVKDLVDEQKLYDTIVGEYTHNSDTFEEWSKREVLYRDVKSISAIARMRKGAVPTALKRAEALFVTTNAGLARAVSHFTNSEGGRHHICECITDVLLGTLVWLNSPSIIQDLQHRRILADAVAALRPDENLIEKYRVELNKLKDRREITEREYYYLRGHPRPLQRLEEKTFGDPDAFYDRLPEEILAELRSEIETEIRKVADVEANKQLQTISVLESELGKAQKDSGELRQAVERSKGRMGRIANAITMAFSVMSSIGLLALLLVSIQPAQRLVWRLVIGIPLAAISALNMIFGFTVKSYFRPVRDWVQRKLLRIVGIV